MKAVSGILPTLLEMIYFFSTPIIDVEPTKNSALCRSERCFYAVIALQKGNHRVHHHKMGDAAQQDEQVENFVAAEAEVVPAGPLGGIEHAAHGVQKSPGQQPGKTGGGQ